MEYKERSSFVLLIFIVLDVAITPSWYWVASLYEQIQSEARPVSATAECITLGGRRTVSITRRMVCVPSQTLEGEDIVDKQPRFYLARAGRESPRDCTLLPGGLPVENAHETRN